MTRRGRLRAILLLVGLGSVGALAALGAAPRQRPAVAQGPAGRPNGGWTIPPEAKAETNPLEVDAVVLAAGRALFKSKCQRCHGPAGKGDGPDADPDHQTDMDLTRPDRADANPDGVVFYKVWNGRQRPKMPAFKSEMTREEVWTVVSYVQTLRGKP